MKGHILRHMNDLLHVIIERRISGKKDRGRSQTSYIKKKKKTITDAGLTSYRELKRLPDVREEWIAKLTFGLNTERETFECLALINDRISLFDYLTLSGIFFPLSSRQPKLSFIITSFTLLAFQFNIFQCFYILLLQLYIFQLAYSNNASLKSFILSRFKL